MTFHYGKNVGFHPGKESFVARQTEQDIAAMTPMLRPFYDLKNKAEDAILFFRMGIF